MDTPSGQNPSDPLDEPTAAEAGDAGGVVAPPSPASDEVAGP
jgi:hypothetical protein